ncbi:MAG: Flp pilus assembly protein CpaB [Hyphomicrobiaceae bacterium]
MKKAQLIGFAIAGVFGLGTFMMAKGIVKKEPEVKVVERAIDATQVLVAKTDIALGQVVTDQHMQFIQWPKKGVRRGFLTSKNRGIRAELAGSIARAPMIAGEVITKTKLIKPGQGGVLAAILKKGMRAIATSIRQKTAVGGLVLPNDHVDVILTREIRQGGGSSSKTQTVSDTLFRNVRVLAIGQDIETKEGRKSASGSGDTTATLELSPRQAEMMALANKAGTITLTLRSVADLNKLNGTTVGADLDNERGNAIGVLRYGVPSRAYGVN